jgi:hypothetical protein
LCSGCRDILTIGLAVAVGADWIAHLGPLFLLKNAKEV